MHDVMDLNAYETCTVGNNIETISEAIHMKYVLTEKNVADIEKAINARGTTMAIVSVADGKIQIVMAEKKLIS